MDACSSNKGWPQGTGIRISLSGTHTQSASEIAESLSCCGCPPDVAIRAAACILENGIYETRVRTSTALSHHVWQGLEHDGLLLSIEDRAPEGNKEHATDTEYERQARRIARHIPSWAALELSGPTP